MFKVMQNRAVLRLQVRTTTPLLIRAGDPGLDAAGTELTAVRVRHAHYGRSVYIPGSSLKGVVRSAAEALIRGRKLPGVDGACDLFGKTSCGHRFSAEKQKTPAIHKQHCGICRTFGSTALKGRASLRDLFPWSEPEGQEEQVARANRTEVRHGVAISRMSGAVQHGPFDMELVPPGVSFFGEVGLENYQVWQLGLLASAFGELNDGFAQLGSSKSRGLGGVQVEVGSILHEQRLGPLEQPAGVAKLSPSDENVYGLFAEGDLPVSRGELRGLRRRYEVTGEAVAQWLDAGEAALGRLLEGGV